jgi:prepilin-type N-terminal cleavage/methylation domain-containing protein
VARSADSRRRRGARGFSLVELLVVVTLIAIIALLAIPSMTEASDDRRAYDDAGYVMQLFRTARQRAIGRGAAILVAVSTDGTTDRGTFKMYEAVHPNPAGGGEARYPRSSCKSPTTWAPLNSSNTDIWFVDGVDFNTARDGEAQVTAKTFIYNGATATATNTAYVCFSPSGRAYGSTSAPSFDAAMPLVAPIEIRVEQPGGITRRVVVPPMGQARLHSD